MHKNCHEPAFEAQKANCFPPKVRHDNVIKLIGWQCATDSICCAGQTTSWQITMPFGFKKYEETTNLVSFDFILKKKVFGY